MATQTIDGKIFQLKNAAGTENRFPRTVMEAVYGLNTYLQQQFAGLANLYEEKGYVAYNATTKVLTVGGVNVDLANLSDYYTKTQADGRYLKLTGGTLTGQLVSTVATGTSPLSVTSTTLNANLNADLLDGKHLSEILASNVASATKIKETTREDEEFVFQATPVHDINDGFRLDAIKGRTLAWNQLVRNANFEDFSAWSVGTGKLTIDTTNHTATLVSESALDNTEIRQQMIDGRSMLNGHRYYASFKATTRKKVNIVAITYYGGAAYPRTIFSDATIQAGETRTFSKVFDFKSGDGYNLFGFSLRGTGCDFTIYGGLKLIDLTLMFGAGNEPSTVEEFEAMFPEAYYPYNAGTLKSNDAEALETGGFNEIDTASGELSSQYFGHYYVNNDGTLMSLASNNAFRVKVFPNTAYYYKKSSGENLGGPGIIRFEDADKNFISFNLSGYSEAYVAFTTPVNAAYIVISVASGVSYAMQLNLSDASRNGQYEPYWKRRIELGLKSFKVKDGQGNVITITGGLKSAGSVYDEIVGNKYVKRVGSVDLGTAAVLQSSQVANAYVFDFGPSIAQPTSSTIQTAIVNAVCERYIAVAYQNIADKTMAYRQSSSPNARGIIIKDSAWNGYSESQVKSAMSGVMLYYELATPIEYELAEPMPMTGKINGYGTMRRIGASEPSAPFRADITYGLNPGQTASDLSALVASIYRDTLRINGLDVAGDMVVGGTSTFNGLNVDGDMTVSGISTFNDEVYLESSLFLSATDYISHHSTTVGFHFAVPSHFTSGLYSDSYITAGATASSSDKSLKESITDVTTERAISVLNQLKPKEWIWNDKNAYLSGRRGAGLVAQDVQSVLPFAVVDDGEFLALNYNVLHAYEIAGLKNHEDRIAALESKLLKTN